MNKTVKAIIVIAVGAIVAGGAVYFLTSQKDTAKDTASSGTSNSTNTQQTSKKLEGNELVQVVLDKVKAGTPTVTATRVFTETTDPNNSLGKAGQYQYAGSFYDTRTVSSEAVTDNYSTTSGGTIEIYATEKDATTRGEYLTQFQTGAIQAGAYKVIDKNVLRVSENYTASQQKEMLALMESAL